MQHWLMWADKTSIGRSLDLTDFSFDGARRLRMARGDVILLLADGVLGSVEFYQYGMVAEIEKELPRGVEFGEDAVQEYGRVMIRVKVEEWRRLPIDNDLDSLRYSLIFIADPENPLRSLRNSYRKIPRVDFETIRRGDIFLTRAAYFKLFNALHPDMQAEFEVQERVGSTRRLPRLTYLERLRRLDQFIQERILSVGNTLQSLSTAANRLELQYEGSLVRHVFSNNADEGAMFHRGYDDIDMQTRLFAELETALKPLEEVERIAEPHSLVNQVLMWSGEGGENYSSQARLESIFKGK